MSRSFPRCTSERAADGDVGAFVPGGETTWATAHSGAYALGVAVGPSGEIAVVGGLGIGEGDGDGESELVRKLDGTTGELVWSLWEPGWNVGGDSVAFDPGGDILVGASDFGAAYVYKVDGALGTIDWKRTLASPTRTPQSFGVSAIGGDVVVAGTFEGSVSTAGTTLQSLGEYDIYGFRLGPDGSVVASVGYGHGGSENAFGGGFTSEGSPVAVGIVGSMFVDLFVAKLDL